MSSRAPKPEKPPVAVAPAPYVRIPLAAAITGYTEVAIERKIESDVWRKGEVWVKAPDGSRMISIEGYRRWVESGDAQMTG